MGGASHFCSSITTFSPPFRSPKPRLFSLKQQKTLAISVRHFSKHLNYPSTVKPISASFTCSSYSSHSFSHSPQIPEPKPLKISFFNNLSHITPFDICKWAGIVSLSIAATKRTLSLILSPFFWLYFSWTWIFWPWFLAIALAIYGLYCLRKHSLQSAGIGEQLVIVASAVTWMTLVPPAYFNGYLEGWPFVFFFAYHYFFFFDASIRKRLYGDLCLRPHDPKWDVSVPGPVRLVFAAAVMIGHWLAAAEGPELHLMPGGWANFGIWILIMAAQFMKYHSTLYLANYSEKVGVPTSVVQFGPYRWVRHPIYASVMLLFAAYFAALRAPFSLLFVLAVCVAYYDRKTKLEEALMVEEFKDSYTVYMSKVPYKFIPLVY